VADAGYPEAICLHLKKVVVYSLKRVSDFLGKFQTSKTLATRYPFSVALENSTVKALS
jgi:hypothetical protein